MYIIFLLIVDWLPLCYADGSQSQPSPCGLPSSQWGAVSLSIFIFCGFQRLFSFSQSWFVSSSSQRTPAGWLRLGLSHSQRDQELEDRPERREVFRSPSSQPVQHLNRYCTGKLNPIFVGKCNRYHGGIATVTAVLDSDLGNTEPCILLNTIPCSSFSISEMRWVQKRGCQWLRFFLLAARPVHRYSSVHTFSTVYISVHTCNMYWVLSRILQVL